MNVKGIKSIKAEKLYSIEYEGFDANELVRLFQNWKDPNFLNDFFTTFTEDLYSGFYPTDRIENAISDTILEAKALSKAIRDNIDNLSGVFFPLSPADNESFPHPRCKAKGHRSKSWLRIYGINLGDNCYVVTGGAIKLTKAMGSRRHTKLELDKLEKAKQWLLEAEIIDNIDLENFELGL